MVQHALRLFKILVPQRANIEGLPSVLTALTEPWLILRKCVPCSSGGWRPEASVPGREVGRALPQGRLRAGLGTLTWERRLKCSGVFIPSLRCSLRTGAPSCDLVTSEGAASKRHHRGDFGFNNQILEEGTQSVAESWSLVLFSQFVRHVSSVTLIYCPGSYLL